MCANGAVLTDGAVLFSQVCYDHFMKIDVLYEDNHLIAVNKPAGILVQEELLPEVKNFLKEKYQKPGNVFVGLIHRLDRNVSGIVLLAKTSKGAARLSEQFREHTTEKIYHAWVEGAPKNEKGTLKNYLVKDENKNKTTVYDEEVPGSDYAELSFEVIKKEGGYSLLKIYLKTGRSHQIRAQLAYIGCPIVGDIKYGAKEALKDQSLKLVATELHFDTATEGKREVIKIAIPELK
jgi:23S rRNA pseudouridine1911/1915/1917 synthase